MNFHPNKLYFKLAKLFSEKNPNKLLIVANEGSARAAKTYDAFHFFVAMCDANRTNPQEIYFVRDTLVNCRDFTLNEFKRCLGTFYDEEGNKHGIGIWDNKNFIGSPKPTYNLFGHKIKFRGIDEIAEAFPSDFIFFNEVLDIPTDVVKSLLMRCRKMAIMDFNPKYSDHEIFSFQKRSDTVFTHTTYKDNRFTPHSFVQQVESYNPDIPENVTSGTADKYRWKVYGLGERCNREGLVFPNVTWIDAMPADCEHISYGMDFGTAAPTAIIKAAMKKTDNKPNLYLQKLHYAPCANSDEVNEILGILKIEKHIWSDTDMMGRGWIADLRAKDKEVYPTRKFPGSREYWITTLNRFNIHIVRDIDFRKEQEKFCYRVVDGKQLSETIKAYDHLWSASGYAVVGDFRDIITDEE